MSYVIFASGMLAGASAALVAVRHVVERKVRRHRAAWERTNR